MFTERKALITRARDLRGIRIYTRTSAAVDPQLSRDAQWKRALEARIAAKCAGYAAQDRRRLGHALTPAQAASLVTPAQFRAIVAAAHHCCLVGGPHCTGDISIMSHGDDQATMDRIDTSALHFESNLRAACLACQRGGGAEARQKHDAATPPLL